MSRFQYPANIRVVRIPCTGRLDPILILRALREGADGVLVAGCHPGECNYTTGNLYARRRLMLFKRMLAFIGIEDDRVHYAWISSAEGGKFASVAREVIEKVRALGPAEKLVAKDLEL